MDAEAESVTAARSVLRQVQDAALARSVLAAMPEWIASGSPPPVAELWEAGFRHDDTRDPDAWMVRAAFHRRWGYSIPGAEAVAALLALGPMVEVGAGTGYWSALLHAAGADIVATDPTSQGDVGYGFQAGAHHRVEDTDAITAAARWPERAIFCSWPTRDDDWAADMAAGLAPGRKMALIVEPANGRTATPRLYDILRTDYRPLRMIALPQFPTYRDALLLVERA